MNKFYRRKLTRNYCNCWGDVSFKFLSIVFVYLVMVLPSCFGFKGLLIPIAAQNLKYSYYCGMLMFSLNWNCLAMRDFYSRTEILEEATGNVTS